MSRTKEEIKVQIEGLKKEKSIIPTVGLFGTKNHLIIDYQIDILENKTHIDDIEEDDFEESQDFTDVFEKAEETVDWLAGRSEGNLFGDYSED